MRLVPGVVVHDGGPVAHARDLVAVVPPAHHARARPRVVSEPAVGLAVVVDDDAPVALVVGHDDRGVRVGFCGRPGAVEDDLAARVENDRQRDDGELDRYRGLEPGRQAEQPHAERLDALGQLAEDVGHADAREHAAGGPRDEHQADHDRGEVGADEAVEHGEELRVLHFLEAVVGADR